MALLFWLGVGASVLWGGLAVIGLAVSEHYHPMAAHGDLLEPLRKGALIGPALTAVVMFSVWLQQRPLSNRAYLIGLSVLAAAALLPALPRLDSGYRQVYWLGDSRHEIPWQYRPYNGSPYRGGKSFLLRVSMPDLIPYYERTSDEIIIGKAVDFNFGDGGTAPTEMCAMIRERFTCEWQRGDFVFRASGRNELFPSDASGFMVSVADLLDSFEVPEP